MSNTNELPLPVSEVLAALIAKYALNLVWEFTASEEADEEFDSDEDEDQPTLMVYSSLEDCDISWTAPFDNTLEGRLSVLQQLILELPEILVDSDTELDAAILNAENPSDMDLDDETIELLVDEEEDNDSHKTF
jgi:hypothetical protein